MKIDLKPWITPNFVSARNKRDAFDNAIAWHICEVDSETLSEQCDKFRDEVFKKAGKVDPKQQANEG